LFVVVLVKTRGNSFEATHNAQRTTHNAQRTTHNAQRTTMEMCAYGIKATEASLEIIKKAEKGESSKNPFSAFFCL
jgi:hypothetical protein